MILVVGATGQVGRLVVAQLLERGHPVRAMVRSAQQAAELQAAGASVVVADLRDPRSLDAAVEGAEAVVATANVVAPTRRGDTHRAVEERGYAALIDSATRAGLRRFVLASVPVSRLDTEVPTLRAKRLVEQRLQAAGLEHLSVRLAPFTEVWLALVGSSLPLRGEKAATLDRPYPFLRTFRRLSGTTIEDRGLLVLPGPASNRNAFLSVHDAARVLAAAVDAPSLTGAVDVGGPQVLSWHDVADLYADVLGRPVRIVSLPGAAFTGLQRALAPVAPAASNVMGMNRLMAAMSSDGDSTDVLRRLGVQDLRTVEDVLRAKVALPASA